MSIRRGLSGRSVGRALLVALALTAAPFTTAAAPASAAATQIAVDYWSYGGSAPQPGGGFTSCAITVNGYTGYRICEYDWTKIQWSSGVTETYVIGTTHQIYRIGPNTGGWKSLGGQAMPLPTYQGIYINNSHTGIKTYGTTSSFWCRDYPYSNGWYPC